jgi:tRNA dimethylallyltransferase
MKRLFVITGPTASGKTDIAIARAQEMGGARVSADSRQVYAGMNIGTAKPKFAWRDEAQAGEAGDVTGPVPHYLFNIRRPDQPLSLSEWQAMAFQAIDHIHSDDNPAILTGGTMLYIDSIVKNYDLPHVAPNEELRAEYAKLGVPTLYAQLLEKDPKAQSFIQPNNKRRIIRALEVMAATGRPFSEQRRQRPPRYDITAIGLFDGWGALEERIQQRVQNMLKEGLLKETNGLVQRYGADLPLLQTINYREALAGLVGRLSEKEVTREMVRANLHYARRQMSWWRGRKDIAWCSPADWADIKKRLLGD